MKPERFPRRGLRRRGFARVLAVCLLAGLTTSASAQDEAASPPADPGVVQADGRPTADVPGAAPDGGVVPAGCSTCAGGLLGGALDLGPVSSGCVDGCCYPGRRPCDCPCDSSSGLGRLLCGFYQCVCCPDPCYEPCWVPLANAALFTDPTRPVTQLRLRGDFGWGLPIPDRSEWFWARENRRGPRLPGTVPPGGQPPGERQLEYKDGTLTMEGAAGRFSLAGELPYRHIEPSDYRSASGFADMNITTKSLHLDCDLMQLAFQFRTYLPTGDFTQGIGNGHVSLEPSLLTSVKLTPTSYFQGQLSYWFPIGGDPDYQGNVFQPTVVGVWAQHPTDRHRRAERLRVPERQLHRPGHRGDAASPGGRQHCQYRPGGAPRRLQEDRLWRRHRLRGHPRPVGGRTAPPRVSLALLSRAPGEQVRPLGVGEVNGRESGPRRGRGLFVY
jgi:hypothetical protein